MTEAYKVLAQVQPLATTLTTAYTVPASTSVIISSIMIANQDTAATTFRVSIAVAGAADDPKQYIYYDIPIPKKNTFTFTVGITLATTDEVRVYAGSANVSFNIFGTELT